MNLTIKDFPHYNQRPLSIMIDTIVLHSMYCPFPPTPDEALNPIVCLEWLNKCQVSAHYLISQEGEVFQLVSPVHRAWHAGKSKMPDGRENVNDFSIGIELLSPSPGHYPEKQLAALRELILNLKKEYQIKYILGHKDVAVNRNQNLNHEVKFSSESDYLKNSQNEMKTDPWDFPWERIADLS